MIIHNFNVHLTIQNVWMYKLDVMEQQNALEEKMKLVVLDVVFMNFNVMMIKLAYVKNLFVINKKIVVMEVMN